MRKFQDQEEDWAVTSKWQLWRVSQSLQGCPGAQCLQVGWGWGGSVPASLQPPEESACFVDTEVCHGSESS